MTHPAIVAYFNMIIIILAAHMQVHVYTDDSKMAKYKISGTQDTRESSRS